MSALEWARRRRRVSTAMIAMGPAVMVVGILATAVTALVADRFFIAFLFAGGVSFSGGLLVRYRAEPVFAPRRLLDREPEG